MKQKEVCQLNEQGYFIGTTIADESPLEEGVFHLPRNSIDVPAPVIPENHLAKWSNGNWEFEAIPEPEVEEPEEVSPNAERIGELKLLLSQSDFKVLPDYDKPNEEIIALRKAWREEIRLLEDNTAA